jgi:hypothetical protein
MSSTPHPSKPPEPGTIDAAKKLRDHQTDSVYGKLTDQESVPGPDEQAEPSGTELDREDKPRNEGGKP